MNTLLFVISTVIVYRVTKNIAIVFLEVFTWSGPYIKSHQCAHGSGVQYVGLRRLGGHNFEHNKLYWA